MINIAIAGYGNVGRGVINALKNNPDMKLSAVFSSPAPGRLSALRNSAIKAPIPCWTSRRRCIVLTRAKL
jgi:glyceraldehyde-3-phosphate dehydrogenase/erythrose-4-phosphate dehydrogenase